MDLNTVTSVRLPASREELALAPGETLLGGGTWLYSEPQPGTTGLVDLRALAWDPIRIDDDGTLRIAATCTISELGRITPEQAGSAHLVVEQARQAFLASYKIWNVATVGGNICMALPAGPMISLVVALDASLLVWSPDGTTRRVPAEDFVRGVRHTALEPGEVLRSIDIPPAALGGRAAFRKAALQPIGRSAAVVIGRVTADGEVVLCVSASTDRPYVFRFAGSPTAAELAAAVDSIEIWYDDQHGAPDWRRAQTLRLAEEVRTELAEGAR